MPVKPVDDIANKEMEFRLARILSDVVILKHVADHLKDTTLQHRIRELHQSIGGTVSFVRRKYGVRLSTTAYKED